MPRIPRHPGTGKAPVNTPAAGPGYGQGYGPGWGGPANGAHKQPTIQQPPWSADDARAMVARCMTRGPGGRAAQHQLLTTLLQNWAAIAAESEYDAARVVATDKLVERLIGKARDQPMQMTGGERGSIDVSSLTPDDQAALAAALAVVRAISARATFIMPADDA